MVGANLDQPYSGTLSGGEHRFALRVYYEDTDAGGVVYHASYLRFMERARSDMLHLLGIDQAAALAAGEGAYVVARLALEYRAAARLSDALLVLTKVAEIRHSSIVVQQRVMRGTTVVTDGSLTIAFVTPGGRPRRQPAAWMAAFKSVTGADGA